jgi:hypothetical protein
LFVYSVATAPKLRTVQVIQKGGANMNQDSKQQKQQDQYTSQEETGTQKRDQKNSTGYGDKKLNGPDIPST